MGMFLKLFAASLCTVECARLAVQLKFSEADEVRKLPSFFWLPAVLCELAERE